MLIAVSLLAVVSSGDPLIDWLSRAGALGVLALGIVAFIRGWIVPGPTHKRVLAERDRAIDQVFSWAEIAKGAINIAEKVKR